MTTEAPIVFDLIEQRQILERASVEPELDEEQALETDSLLGVSKRKIPKRLILLFAILVLFYFSVLCTVPVSIDLNYRYVCSHYDIAQEMCSRDELANKVVANFTGVNTSLSGAFSLFVASMISIMSDIKGRKPMFVAAMTMNCLAVATSWKIYFHTSTEHSYWILLLPTIIDGLGGGGVAILQLLTVPYISDMVPEAKNRTRLMAMSTGSLLVAVALGPASASWIVPRFGQETLYIGAIAGTGLSAALAFVFLRESLSPYHKRRNSESGPRFKKTARSITFKSISDPIVRRNARLLGICTLLVVEYNHAFTSILILFPKLRFGWTAVEAGYLLSSMFSIRAFWFVLGFPFLYKLLSRRYTLHSDRVDVVDKLLMSAALTIGSLATLAMGLSKTPKQYFLSGIFDSCTALGTPIFLSALVKHVPSTEVGSFMAAFNVCISALSTFAPSLFMKLYSVTLEWKPELSFELLSGTFALLLLLVMSMRPAR